MLVEFTPPLLTGWCQRINKLTIIQTDILDLLSTVPCAPLFNLLSAEKHIFCPSWHIYNLRTTCIFYRQAIEHYDMEHQHYNSQVLGHDGRGQIRSRLWMSCHQQGDGPVIVCAGAYYS